MTTVDTPIEILEGDYSPPAGAARHNSWEGPSIAFALTTMELIDELKKREEQRVTELTAVREGLEDLLEANGRCPYMDRTMAFEDDAKGYKPYPMTQLVAEVKKLVKAGGGQ